MTTTWPIGSTEARIAQLDDRITSTEIALTEAKQHGNRGLVAICMQRLDELLAQKALLERIPQPRATSD